MKQTKNKNMNSKRIKKEKVKVEKQSNTESNEPEITNIPENNKKKKKKSANNNVENIENSSKPVKKKKAKQILEENKTVLINKKSKKSKLNVSGDNELPTNGISFNDSEQYIKKSLSDEDNSDNEESKVNAKENSIEKKKEEIMWSNEDLMELVANLEKIIPKNDVLAFTTRTEKLEWDKVVFKDYTAEECKKTWYLLSKKIRKYRLLHEVLDDARQLIVNPPSQKKKNKQIHPDMPKRPLSSYLLFYLKKKDKIIAEFPGIELTEISKKIGNIYKNLPPEKKAIYEEMAAKAKEEYEEKMKEFYANHPEFKVVKPQKVIAAKPIKERAPKKPTTPFGFYYQSELKKENIPDAEKHQFKERCKSRWKEMSDKKKLIWITWAEEQNALYENDLQTYKANHPDYVVNHTTKLILTKEEKSVKERVAGKPVKPPNSAYALFSKVVMQTPEVKAIPNKERWNFIAAQWKNCSEGEKKHYKDLQTNMMDQYKVDFAHYLETLPEDKRNLELQNNAPKKRKSEEHVDAPRKKRKKAQEKPAVKTQEQRPKFQEPEQPPRSPFKYFTTVYSGKESAIQAWRKLSAEEKEKYEQELIKKKHEYIAAFEKFLKNLSKEELEAFSNSRNQVKQKTPAESDEEDEEEEEEEEEQDEESDDQESSGSNSDSSDDE